MADLSLDDELRFRRKAMATTTTINHINDDNDTDELPGNKDSALLTPSIPPPLPQKSDLTKSGNKQGMFDLRPLDMRDGNDQYGRPHISAIGNAHEQPNHSGINANDIISMKARLRTTSGKKPENGINEQTQTVTTKLTPRNPIKRHQSTPSTDANDMLNEMANLRKQVDEMRRMRSSGGQALPQRKQSIDYEPEVISTPKRMSLSSTQSYFTDDTNTDRIEGWIERIEPPTKKEDENVTLRPSMTQRRRSRSLKSTTTNGESEHDVVNDMTVAKTNGILKAKKTKSRAPSVCFSFPDGNSEISEESKDDIIDFKIETPEAGTYEYISNQLNIREPFTQVELNVLHAICEEYAEIASLTLAKRKLFARTLPPHERVYGFIASTKKSGWVEKSDIKRGALNSKTLDFLFSVTLRRRSKKIEGHTLNLKGFNEGRTLDERRFKRIIESAFERRSYLFNCIVGKLSDYSRIR